MAGEDETACGCPGVGWTSEATSVIAALTSASNASTVDSKNATQYGITGSMLRNQHLRRRGRLKPASTWNGVSGFGRARRPPAGGRRRWDLSAGQSARR